MKGFRVIHPELPPDEGCRRDVCLRDTGDSIVLYVGHFAVLELYADGTMRRVSNVGKSSGLALDVEGRVKLVRERKR